MLNFCIRNILGNIFMSGSFWDGGEQLYHILGLYCQKGRASCIFNMLDI